MAGNLTQFACTGCGAPVEIRAAGQSLVVACGHCGSVMDANSPAHQILSKAEKHRRIQSSIPLGCKCSFDGQKWQVVGFMVRTDKSGYYSWSEYLLQNPKYGFRWLVENQGHWSYVTPIKGRPEQGYSGMQYQGRSFRLFLTDAALVDYVEGEFFWRVERGEQTTTMDYVAPPFMLSGELSQSEEVWSVGEYFTQEAIEKAFAPTQIDYPPQSGVAPHEVNPHSATMAYNLMICIAFCLISLVMMAPTSGSNAFTSILLLAIYPGFQVLAHSNFEQQRWSNSDFPISTGGGDSDDE